MLARIIPVEGPDGRPDQGLPPAVPGFPDNTLPEPPPGVWPPPVVSHPIQPAPPHTPPGTIWPPANPARPDQGLPKPPPSVDNKPPGVNTKFWIVAGIPGYGWKYVCIDTSLVVDNSPITPPAVPGQGLPPTPAPKA
jgi:hypothetical protein